MLRYFYLWLGVGWLMVISLAYFSLIHNPPEFNISFEYFDKVRHFIAYFFLMFWFSQIYKAERIRFFYLSFLIILGAVLEVLQGLGGVRYFEYYDMLANSLGVILAWLITKGRLSNILFKFEILLLQNKN